MNKLGQYLKIGAAVTAGAGALWCLAVAGRSKHPQWAQLERYRYAHRGYHEKPQIPENSLPAFRRAVQAGFGAELDVHLTKDGRLAVLHDSLLVRSCGVLGRVEDCTAAELARFRLEGTEEKLPFLEEVLPIFAEKTPLVIEIKPIRRNHVALTSAVCRLLDSYPGAFCIESFDPRVLRWLRKNRPEIVRGQLSANFVRHAEGLSISLRFILTNLLTNFWTCPDFVAYQFSDRHAPSLRLCRRLWGVREIDWTVTNHTQQAIAEKAGSLVIFERYDPRKTEK